MESSSAATDMTKTGSVYEWCGMVAVRPAFLSFDVLDAFYEGYSPCKHPVPQQQQGDDTAASKGDEFPLVTGVFAGVVFDLVYQAAFFADHLDFVVLFCFFQFDSSGRPAADPVTILLSIILLIVFIPDIRKVAIYAAIFMMLHYRLKVVKTIISTMSGT
jgi:hypothetical protein